MRTIAENLARRPNRILHRSTQPHPGRSVEHPSGARPFALCLPIEKAATPGIEGLVVLQNNDGFLDRIESTAPRWSTVIPH